jgi:hypothetical protein
VGETGGGGGHPQFFPRSLSLPSPPPPQLFSPSSLIAPKLTNDGSSVVPLYSYEITVLVGVLYCRVSKHPYIWAGYVLSCE